MGIIHRPKTEGCGLARPRRNRYFYGKLLDAYHFELETGYMNAKRRLLNRLVTGYGVICGLNVKESKDGDAVVVTPGVAIDPWGREIIVDQQSAPLAIPDQLAAKQTEEEPYNVSEKCCYECRDQTEEEHWAHLVLCYHECESEPAPVLAGECGEACRPGVIVERYSLAFRPGCVAGFREEADVPDFIKGGKLNYSRVAEWVSEECPSCPEDPCIPLANVHLEIQDQDQDQDHCCRPGEIDISVRPIVWTHDLLFELLWSHMVDKAPKRRK